MISANQAYRIAIESSHQNEREEKQLKEIERLIEERAKRGSFYIELRRINICNKNRKVLQDLGYDIEIFYGSILDACAPTTRISWYKD